MAYFIPAVLVPFFILLLFFVHRKDLRDLIAGGENKCEECSYNVVSKLTRKKIEFLYKLSLSSLENAFRVRDEENKTILSHATFFIAVSTFFFILGSWTYRHSGDVLCFVVLCTILAVSVVYLILSIISIFLAFMTMYEFSPMSKKIVELSDSHGVNEIKKMLIHRWINCTDKNNFSNTRKMQLLTISRKFLFCALVLLVIAFLFIILVKYASIVVPITCFYCYSCS